MSAKFKKIFAGVGIFLFCFSVRAQNGGQKEIHLTLVVVDEYGRYAGGLKAENIQLTVDKKPQAITSFAGQDAPATVVFLIDLSGTQKGIVERFAGGIEYFVKNANPDNEYVVIAFNTKIQLVSDNTEDLKTLETVMKRTLTTAPKGNTAFYDSAYAAIEKADSGKYQKKILVVCSDGTDNQSQYYKMRDVVESLKQSDVLVYGISYSDGGSLNFLTNTQGTATLDNLAYISGGKSFFPQTPVELTEIFKRIAMELKYQYQIGFRIAELTKSEKWREVRVKVSSVTDNNKKIKLMARTRNGFYPMSAK